jgi:hypothetical protein
MPCSPLKVNIPPPSSYSKKAKLAGSLKTGGKAGPCFKM